MDDGICNALIKWYAAWCNEWSIHLQTMLATLTIHRKRIRYLQYSYFFWFQILYESKFILDSFLFHVSPARFLRCLAANVDFSTQSHDLLYLHWSYFKGWYNHCRYEFSTVSLDFFRLCSIIGMKYVYKFSKSCAQPFRSYRSFSRE